MTKLELEDLKTLKEFWNEGFDMAITSQSGILDSGFTKAEREAYSDGNKNGKIAIRRKNDFKKTCLKKFLKILKSRSF